MSDFTPGPWTLGRGDTSKIKAGSGANAFVVAEVATPTQRRPEVPHLANARLVAAAPEMFDALMEIAHGSPDLAKIDRIARAAIAKAEGRAP